MDMPIEALLSKLADHPIHQSALRPQFTTDVGRTLWLIKRGGADLELAIDEGEINGSGRTISLHELEIELKRGPRAALFHLAAELAGAIPVRIGVQSKAERGHALGAQHDAEVVSAESIVLANNLTAEMGLQAIGYACLRHYRLNEARFLKSPTSENLHQCRVALRRLRSGLDLFRPLLGDPESDTVRERLRDAAALFSDGRNIDILIDRVDEPALVAKLLPRREQIYADLLAGLRSTEFSKLLLDLTAWIGAGAWLSVSRTEAARNQPIRRYAVRALGRYRRRLKRRGKHLARLDAAHRHATRITTKKLRYAAEFFGRLFPGKTRLRRRKQFLKSAESLQSALGYLNDETTCAELIKHLGIRVKWSEISRPALHKDHLIRSARKSYKTLMDITPFWD